MLLSLLADAAEDPTPATAEPLTWEGIWELCKKWLFNTGVKIAISLLLIIVTFTIINIVTKKIYKRLQKKQRDETLSRVGTQTARILLKVLVLVCLIGYVGIETASISAVIASIGVGISLAVQGTLSNFAGGVIIIVMRPFKIGDYIVSNDHEGTVEDIRLFYTHLVTPDNKEVVIPNGALANNVIVNASAKDTRRVDLVIPVSYKSDVDKVKELLMGVVTANELAFKDPAPFVEMSKLNDSSLDFTVRVWCKRPDYWKLYFALLDNIKRTLDENGIEIPYTQFDVHVQSEKAEEKTTEKENKE